MTPAISARRIGGEQQPVAIVDNFHPDPAGLAAFAQAQPFAPAGRHYPGIRADLPSDYFRQVRPALTTVLRDVFGSVGGPDLIDASFSIVTTPPDALSTEQSLPHFDALEPVRIALVHFLARDGGGTAFFRHRTTGFETIDRDRAPTYFERLNAELGARAPRHGYVRENDPLFERTALIGARYNRAAIYRSMMLHSGAIAPDAVLDADPATGRLTVTAFLALRPA